MSLSRYFKSYKLVSYRWCVGLTFDSFIGLRNLKTVSTDFLEPSGSRTTARSGTLGPIFSFHFYEYSKTPANPLWNSKNTSKFNRTSTATSWTISDSTGVKSYLATTSQKYCIIFFFWWWNFDKSLNPIPLDAKQKCVFACFTSFY